MTETGERVCCSESLKLQSGYALLAFQTLRSISALVGIHLKKEKSCLKKRPTSLFFSYVHIRGSTHVAGDALFIHFFGSFLIATALPVAQ